MRNLRVKGDVIGLNHHKNSNKSNLPGRTPPKEKTQPKSSREGSEKLQVSSPRSKAKIFVGGIPSNFTSQDLEEYFQTFGEILAINLKTKKKNSNVKLGFGTITAEKSTVDKILTTNFHYIQGRKVECQRFIKNNKSKNQLIMDKMLRTLYVIEPLESMSENNWIAFFGRFGRIENFYILPERRVPFQSNPDILGRDHQARQKSQKYDFLKKKALILFETSEGARAAYLQSQRRELVIEGAVVKLAYKWPEQVKNMYEGGKETAQGTKLERAGGKKDQLEEALIAEKQARKKTKRRPKNPSSSSSDFMGEDQHIYRLGKKNRKNTADNNKKSVRRDLLRQRSSRIPSFSTPQIDSPPIPTLQRRGNQKVEMKSPRKNRKKKNSQPKKKSLKKLKIRKEPKKAQNILIQSQPKPSS